MKKFLYAASIFLCFFLLVSSSYAQVSEARQTLENCINEVLAVLKSPEFHNETTQGKAIDKIDALIRPVFSFEQFSARTVGARWSSFNPRQKTDFEDAFANLLRATYLDKLKTYSGEEVVFTGETINKKGDKVGISTAIKLKDKTIPVIYKMIRLQDHWFVYDVVIEGLSLVQNYRSQFQDILASQTPEQLTARVLAQAKKIRETPADAKQ